MPRLSIAWQNKMVIRDPSPKRNSQEKPFLKNHNLWHVPSTLQSSKWLHIIIYPHNPYY